MSPPTLCSGFILGFFLSSELKFVPFSLQVQRAALLLFAEVNCPCVLEKDFLFCAPYLKLAWGVLACVNAGSLSQALRHSDRSSGIMSTGAHPITPHLGTIPPCSGISGLAVYPDVCAGGLTPLEKRDVVWGHHLLPSPEQTDPQGMKDLGFGLGRERDLLLHAWGLGFILSTVK